MLMKRKTHIVRDTGNEAEQLCLIYLRATGLGVIIINKYNF